MGSSAQNSSGVDWCRRRVRFNEAPEKVRRFRRRSGRLWCRAARFNRVPEFRRRSGRLWCRARSSSTGFRRRFSGEGLGGFGAEPGQVQQGVEPGQVQQGSGEGSGEGLGGFGAEPGQVQQGSGEVSGEGSGRLWCRPRSGSIGFR